MSNVWSKLQEARCKLQGIDIKKSGKNTYSNYDYFELGDLMPHINNIMNELKLSSFISYGETESVLTIINTETPGETIEFKTPTKGATLKGCHEVQNLGATQTYLRRYLYVTAFEVVEHDVLDSTTGKDKPQQKAQTKQQTTTAPGQVLTDAQLKRAWAIAKGANWNKENIDGFIKDSFNKDSIREITKKEYDILINAMEG